MIKFFYLLLLAPFFIYSDEFQQAMDHGKFKEAIAIAEQLKGSQGKIKLAQAHLRDQNLEKAFLIYLSALEDVDELTTIPTAEELAFYNDALEIYLSQNPPEENAKKLLSTFGQVFQQHPDFHLLGFFIASGEANFGRFDLFFERFYQSYRRYPNHYMASKIKGVLYIRLFERTRDPVAKEMYREKILENSKRAIDAYDQDIALYKTLIGFADASSKQQSVRNYLSKILDQNMMVPRSDVLFFVLQAVDAQELAMAESFLKDARKRYSYSRALDSAEKYLERAKEKGR